MTGWVPFLSPFASARRAAPVRDHAGLPCTAVDPAGLAFESTAAPETWRDLTVALEQRGSPHDQKRDCPYPQSIEHDIVREPGAVYGPQAGTCFGAIRQTDIELC